MSKVKKLSALLLAVVMMAVVLTGCSSTGSGPNARFIDKLNQARRSNGYSYVVEDYQLDYAADELLDYYVAYERGDISYSQMVRIENELEGNRVRCDNGTVTITHVTHIKASADTFYNSTTYYVSGPVTSTRGRYIGVASERVGSYVIIAVILAY